VPDCVYRSGCRGIVLLMWSKAPAGRGECRRHQCHLMDGHAAPTGSPGRFGAPRGVAGRVLNVLAAGRRGVPGWEKSGVTRVPAVPSRWCDETGQGQQPAYRTVPVPHVLLSRTAGRADRRPTDRARHLGRPFAFLICFSMCMGATGLPRGTSDAAETGRRRRHHESGSWHLLPSTDPIGELVDAEERGVSHGEMSIRPAQKTKNDLPLPNTPESSPIEALSPGQEPGSAARAAREPGPFTFAARSTPRIRVSQGGCPTRKGWLRSS